MSDHLCVPGVLTRLIIGGNLRLHQAFKLLVAKLLEGLAINKKAGGFVYAQALSVVHIQLYSPGYFGALDVFL